MIAIVGELSQTPARRAMHNQNHRTLRAEGPPRA